MPAQGDPHSIADFLEAADQAVRGGRDALADTRRGSTYELLAGPSAILWSRQAQRDRALFRKNYFDFATSDDLDVRVQRWFGGLKRVQAAAGTGTAVFARPSAAAGGGWLYAGTRILIVVPGSQSPPVTYAVAADTPVGASILTLSVPVKATRTGVGTAILAAPSTIRVDDALYDPTFVCTALVCADGTDKETDPAYLARAKLTRSLQRVGYQKTIELTCQAAGAATVVALDAGSLGLANDFGINYVYVGDAGFSTPQALLKACVIAVDLVRVAGCDLQIAGMTPTPITSMVVTIHLYDDPGKFNLVDIKATAIAVLLDAINRRAKFWTFRLDELQGAVMQISDAIQGVIVATTPAPPAIAFPPTLARYTLAIGAIAITFTGPT